MADKTVGADGDIFTDETVRLDFAAGANADVFLDLDKGADKYPIAKSTAIQITGLNDGDILTGVDIDNTGLKNTNGG
jgi:hypothetical protein